MKTISVSLFLIFVLSSVGCQSARPTTRQDLSLRKQAMESVLRTSPKAVAWVKEHRTEIVRTALSVAAVAANLD